MGGRRTPIVARPALFLALLVLLAAGAAHGHAELLFAHLATRPSPAPAEEPFALEVRLVDAARDEVPELQLVVRLFETGTEIADRLQELEGEQESPAAQPLVEVELEAAPGSGLYAGEVPALPAGTYPLRIVEMVDGNPESNSSGTLPVGLDETAEQELILPPVAPGVGAWLLWLVGLPVLAGVLVTILVLTNKGQGEGS